MIREVAFSEITVIRLRKGPLIFHFWAFNMIGLMYFWTYTDYAQASTPPCDKSSVVLICLMIGCPWPYLTEDFLKEQNTFVE